MPEWPCFVHWFAYGGMLRETTTFYKKLAADLAAKVLGWLRYRISFALLWSAIMAICGSRSLSHTGAPADLLLASREGNAPRLWEDIENAGKCVYPTITYTSLLLTHYAILLYLHSIPGSGHVCLRCILFVIVSSHLTCAPFFAIYCRPNLGTLASN